jgi:hypothetical protein
MLAGPALADPAGGCILARLDQFMVTRSAAAHCGWGDALSTATFQNRYRRVADQAAAELKVLASDLTGIGIEKVISDHYSEIDRRVIATVAQESCSGPHVREALEKYGSTADTGNIPLMADKNER